MSLYFVCSIDRIVFIFSPEEEGHWRFSRLSSFQKNKGLEKFVMLYRSSEQAEGWCVQDQTASKGAVIGHPGKELQAVQRREFPPLGQWLLWGVCFTLDTSPPRPPPPISEPPFPLTVPFATVHYSEEGSVARLEVEMHSAPIVDEALEDVLGRLAALMRNLAQRPEMVLFIRSDARRALVPAVRHIKRFLGFVQENGSEFVLVGRGHAIVLSGKGILGSTLCAVLRLVQRVFPAPWPESTVSTMEAAEEFLSDLARAELTAPAAPVAKAVYSTPPDTREPSEDRGASREQAAADAGVPGTADRCDGAIFIPGLQDEPREPEGYCGLHELPNAGAISSDLLDSEIVGGQSDSRCWPWQLCAGCRPGLPVA
mmetsp:Transcript_90719/g.270763  ORF Transcript_90719/g.270763 Transcript_90719/m.270763 type:complete len:370 (+) Transcript_90719:112-1221(+)